MHFLVSFKGTIYDLCCNLPQGLKRCLFIHFGTGQWPMVNNIRFIRGKYKFYESGVSTPFSFLPKQDNNKAINLLCCLINGIFQRIWANSNCKWLEKFEQIIRRQSLLGTTVEFICSKPTISRPSCCIHTCLLSYLRELAAHARLLAAAWNPGTWLVSWWRP